MPSRRYVVAGLLAAAPIAGTVLAQTPLPRSAPKSALIDTGELEPGSFIWHPELSPEGPVVMIVSLPEQLVHVYRNGIEIGVSTCSTGKPGHDTPTGVFVILQKDRDHHSSTYNNAPMPNMQRLTWGGIALHAGRLPGYPASHGCVRLPRRFSEAIFGITHLGVPVIIADTKSAPTDIVHPGLMLPADAKDEAEKALAEAAKKSHHPHDATTDTHAVISIVVSGADREALILRNGEVAWRSPVTIRDPQEPLGNHVYKLMGAADADTGLSWLAHKIHVEDSGGAEPQDVLSRIEIDDWIGAVAILADLNPGSTLVVTDLPAGEETRTASNFIILRSDDMA